MQDCQIIELHTQGLSYREMATALGCSRHAIRYRIKKLGLAPNKINKSIDVENLRSQVAAGISFSEFARRYQHSLSAVSSVAKRHGIRPSNNLHARKELPDQEIWHKYVSGVSLDALHKEYNVSVATIKRHIRSVDPLIEFRDMDQAKRPEALNDRDQLIGLMNKHSIRKIAKQLGVRIGTVQAAVRRLLLGHLVHRQKVNITAVELRDLYQSKKLSITQIAKAYGASPASIARKLKSFDIPARPACGEPRPSRHYQLNNKSWLYSQYVEQQKSMGWIAAEVGTTIGNVSHFLRKHEIAKRTKREVYKQLRSKQSKKAKIETPWGWIKVDSKLEQDFLRSLPDSVKLVIREPTTFAYRGSEYTPDFQIDSNIVEVKPRSWMEKPGVNRQKYLKQLWIAGKNSVDVKYWDREYYIPAPVNDEDIYFSLDWRLVFDNPEEVLQFYKDVGFRPLKWPHSSLLRSMRWIVPDDHKLDATYPCTAPLRILKHFNEHYWYSSHRRYSPIARAFDNGNENVLRAAIEVVWGHKRNVNVYALVNAIKRHYKDFLEPSLFKPWIAQAIYDRLLPNGGVVFDPCLGWGGRLLGTIDRDIQYLGSDLNPCSVQGSRGIAALAGAAFAYDPELDVADARQAEIPDVDLLFTSPPYDDGECYYGLTEQCSDTTEIYRHLFTAKCPIVLNIPIRHTDLVMKIASVCGYKLIDKLVMKNNTLITRESTHEPILVFKR